MNIFLYGPSGAGKSTLGKKLARALNLSFIDLDSEFENRSGFKIPDIFASKGESAFRLLEHETLSTLLLEPVKSDSVIALGGGALLKPESRTLAESHGRVLLLTAPFDVLLKRVTESSEERPLLSSSERSEAQSKSASAQKLQTLLAARAGHYASFPVQIDTSSASPAKLVKQIQSQLGWFHVRGMGRHGYDVRVEPGGLNSLGAMLKARNLGGPVAVVSDSNVAALHGDQALKSLREAGYNAELVIFPAGEQNKTLETVAGFWQAFLALGMDRKSTVVALGGGVTGDLAGYAAASYLRGVDWVGVPTTLLAMADSSLGGKTGFDLPQGKNLIGAFHPPQLVLADPETLSTLPERELRSGLGEVVKAGLIADKGLFEICSQGWEKVESRLDEVVRRSMSVKIEVIEADPYEKGFRAALNLGHTIGHAIELASGFELFHGEAIVIGMVIAAQMAEKRGVARPGLTDEIRGALTGLGLPVDVPAGMNPESIIKAVGVDKKKASGKIKFVLPVRPGLVQVGVEVAGWQEMVLEEIKNRTRSGRI
ncbi:MAG: 3-dehydroquinate synthase [Anaerolineae bacterium]|nr:3-dehydroquinate synthase [Anaerolineae bacterium]